MVHGCTHMSAVVPVSFELICCAAVRCVELCSASLRCATIPAAPHCACLQVVLAFSHQAAASSGESNAAAGTAAAGVASTPGAARDSHTADNTDTADESSCTGSFPRSAHPHAAAATGWELFWLQTRALWRKRLLCAW
jgi:hypothetical protein